VGIDKRKYPRLSPNGNAFAALGRRYARVGRIKNIALGGLAFDYISATGTDGDFSQIDIFLIGEVFHLYGINCEIIYDIQQPVPYKKIESIKPSNTRRCGIKFVTLTEDDTTQLKFFLESHTET
jgi:hypothetical protein